MSLKIWLPLNRDLRNQGISDLVLPFTAENSSIVTNGKLGNCLKTTSVGDIGINYPFNINTSSLSFGGWFKFNKAEIQEVIDTITYTSTNQSSLGNLIGNDSYGGIGLVFKTNDLYNTDKVFSWMTVFGNLRTSTVNQTTTTYTVVFDEWTHFFLVWNRDILTLSFYINGNLFSSKVFNTFSDATTRNLLINYHGIYGGNGFGTPIPFRSNDIRIYDHALSVNEVKELAKGLVCHYKLDQPFAINNLKRNANYLAYNNYSGSGSTATVVDTGRTFDGAKIYRLTYTPNDTSLSSVRTSLHSHGVYTQSYTFLADTKYCYWTLWKPISHSDTVCGGTASNIQGWTEIATQPYKNGWNIVGQKRDGSVTTNKTDNIFTSFKTPSATSGTPIIIDFCQPHLVEGYDYILPEYDYKGTNPTTVTDSSGYGNHGTVVNSLSISNDTPRTSKSTHYNGTSYLYITSISNEVCTVSLWAKWDVIPSGQSVIFVDSKSRLGLGLHSGGILCGSSSGKYKNFSKANLVANTWYHFVVVSPNGYSDTTRKLYINGVEQTPLTTESVWSYGVNELQLGKRSTTSDGFVGRISDFRVYATPLSADAIKELYEVGAKIDKNGNMYGYELKEG